MQRITADVAKVNILQNRISRSLSEQITEKDSFDLKFSDELYAKLYNGKINAIERDAADQHVIAAEKLHSLAEQTLDFRNLAAVCRNDVKLSAFAANRIGGALKLEEEKKEEDAKPSSEEGEDGESSEQKKPDASPRFINMKHDDAQKTRKEIADAAKNAASDISIIEALEDVKDLVDTDAIFSNSTKPADIVQDMEMKIKTLKSMPQMVAMLRMIGRARNIAKKKQATKSKNAVSEISNIVQGDDISKLIPAELMKFHAQKTQFMKDFADKALLQYEFTGKERLASGPIVVLLDKTYSMNGGADVWAASVASAMLAIACKQKRAFVLATFDTSIRKTYTPANNGKMPMAGLMEYSNGNGTDVTAALEGALDIIQKGADKKMRKSDIVLLTDGLSDDRKAPEMRERAKKLGVTIHGVFITQSGKGNDVGLKPWCDKYLTSGGFADIDTNVANAIFSI